MCGDAVGGNDGGGGGGLPTCIEDVDDPSMSVLSSISGSGEGVGGTYSRPFASVLFRFHPFLKSVYQFFSLSRITNPPPFGFTTGPGGSPSPPVTEPLGTHYS